MNAPLTNTADSNAIGECNQNLGWSKRWDALPARTTKTVAIAGFHGTVAAQFELLEQGHGNARQAAQLEDCIGRVMQHAAYHCDACKDIVTINSESSRE